MFDPYTLLKFLHVLLVVVAVGFNASYGIWLARAARNPEHGGFALRTIKVLDDRFANPGYALLLVTGLAMVWIGWPRITDLWIILALVLYALLAILGAFGYAPTLRKQIDVLEAEGPGSAAYRGLARRGVAIGAVLAVLVVAIIFLMITKPTL